MIKGSYSALNCYYLSLIDTDFAKQQFQILKKYFKQTLPFIAGIKEYHTKKCLFGLDIDAGPIVEIAGSTVSYNGKSHYLLANVVLVGEAIILAMRTNKKAM